MRPLTKDEKEAILFCCIVTMTGTFYVMELDNIRTNRALREAAQATRNAAQQSLALQKLASNRDYGERAKEPCPVPRRRFRRW